jgi:hypothetical protein
LSRGLVEFYRQTNQYDKAKTWLETVRDVYDVEHNAASGASVTFLAGAVHFDAGNLETARVLFERLYKEYGRRPFDGSDPKYLQFTLDRTKER